MSLTPEEKTFLLNALRESASHVLRTYNLDLQTPQTFSPVEFAALCEELARSGAQHVVMLLDVLEREDSAAVLAAIESAGADAASTRARMEPGWQERALARAVKEGVIPPSAGHHETSSSAGEQPTTTAHLEEVREAMLKYTEPMLSDGTPMPSTDAETGPLATPDSGPNLSTAAGRWFAAAVHAAVARVGAAPAERFGARKVFIVAVYGQLCTSQATLIPWPEFCRRLLSANRMGLVELARADLVAGMPTEAVRASEVTDRTSAFHFIIDPTARDPEVK